MNFTFLQIKNRFLLPIFLLTACLVLLIAPGLALADTNGPSIVNIYPADGLVSKVGNITVSLTAVDPDFVNYNSVIMSLDGNLVNPIKEYGWIDEYTDDLTQLDIYLPVNLPEGNHTFSLTVADELGHVTNKQWSIQVSQPPLIYPVQPKNSATVNVQKPIISANITDNTAVAPATVELYIDGSRVAANFDPASGVVNFQPTTNLSNEAWHEVKVKASDLAGNTAVSSWRFYVNTFTEMTYPLNDSTCQQCHPRTKHPMTRCGKCHGTNLSATNPTYPLDDCYRCHFKSSKYPASYHTNGLPVADPPLHGARDTDSCVECHGKTWSSGIPPLHNTTDTANQHLTSSTSCTPCHASTLTREHVRRYDANGNQLTCFTCHNGQDVNVQKAIAAKNSACNACHTNLDSGGGHPQHQNGLDAACQTCHSNTILSESQFHQANGCSVCHQSSVSDKVKYAISSKNTSCVACHTQGHNLNLVAKEPDDLPKYPGFTWTVPQVASVWVGESWVPTEYTAVGGKILISSRNTSITSDVLYNWYITQMDALGWQKADGATEPSNYMVMNYQKGTRHAKLFLYNGEYHSPQAPDVGFRVEILYR